MKWVIEHGIFPEPATTSFIEAAQSAGHTCIPWDDDWWSNGKWSKVGDGPVVFRGSLENAARVAVDLPWRPGAFCRVDAFNCSAWYPQAEAFLVQSPWRILPAATLVESAKEVADEIGGGERLFVRPDSPLKPFSGRVVEVEGLSLSDLDHGFYYEDEDLPVLVAPTRELGAEYRLVIVDNAPVAASAYEAAERTGAEALSANHPAWSAAREISLRLSAPEVVYVMDLVETSEGLRLLELNPFSGADLYGCDSAAVVNSVGRCVIENFE